MSRSRHPPAPRKSACTDYILDSSLDCTIKPGAHALTICISSNVNLCNLLVDVYDACWGAPMCTSGRGPEASKVLELGLAQRPFESLNQTEWETAWRWARRRPRNEFQSAVGKTTSTRSITIANPISGYPPIPIQTKVSGIAIHSKMLFSTLTSHSLRCCPLRIQSR